MHFHYIKFKYFTEKETEVFIEVRQSCLINYKRLIYNHFHIKKYLYAKCTHIRSSILRKMLRIEIIEAICGYILKYILLQQNWVQVEVRNFGELVVIFVDKWF